MKGLKIAAAVAALALSLGAAVPAEAAMMHPHHRGMMMGHHGRHGMMHRPMMRHSMMRHHGRHRMHHRMMRPM